MAFVTMPMTPVFTILLSRDVTCSTTSKFAPYTIFNITTLMIMSDKKRAFSKFTFSLLNTTPTSTAPTQQTASNYYLQALFSSAIEISNAPGTSTKVKFSRRHHDVKIRLLRPLPSGL